MKRYILGLLTGILLTSSVVGVVAYNYNAKDVSYTPSDSDWNVNNVEDAIKDLKNKRDIKEIISIQSGTYTVLNSYSKAYIAVTRDSTRELDPVFERNEVVVSPIKTIVSGNLKLFIYRINDVEKNENWYFEGITQALMYE